MSTENIIRPSVNLIFNIISEKYNNILSKLKENNEVKVNFIGENKNLPPKILKIFDTIANTTRNNLKLNLNIAFNYGSDKEILRIVKNIIFVLCSHILYY